VTSEEEHVAPRVASGLALAAGNLELSPKKTCVLIVHPDGRIYSGGLERTQLAAPRGMSWLVPLTVRSGAAIL
jgi:hypothetical protein